MWERPEVRTAAGELVAGTEDRLEVGTELRGLTQDPPPLSEARSGVWESSRAPLGLGGGSGGPWPGKATVAGEGVGIGVTKGLAGGAGGGMLLLTTSPGKASGSSLAGAEGRLHSECRAAGALRPAKATFIV